MDRDWKKVKDQSGVQTWESPLHPDSVEQVQSDDAARMLKHAKEQLEMQRPASSFTAGKCASFNAISMRR